MSQDSRCPFVRGSAEDRIYCNYSNYYTFSSCVDVNHSVCSPYPPKRTPFSTSAPSPHTHTHITHANAMYHYTLQLVKLKNIIYSHFYTFTLLAYPIPPPKRTPYSPPSIPPPSHTHMYIYVPLPRPTHANLLLASPRTEGSSVAR